MKNTVRKITTVLLVLILTAGLIASAMADTVYITEGFTIPAGRIEGDRPLTETPEPTSAAPEAEPADPLGSPDEVHGTDEQKPEEALDENAEGLVVVDGEEKTEGMNITEQTEVRTNEAGTEETVPENQIAIREAPDGLSNIIMTVSPETELNITGTEGQWYKVEMDGIPGYVFGADYAGNEENKIDFSGVSVHLFSNRKSGMQDGEPMILTCRVIGYDLEYPLQYEWSVDRHDGFGWQSVEGSDSTYEFPVSKETLSYDWVVDVFIEVPD